MASPVLSGSQSAVNHPGGRAGEGRGGLWHHGGERRIPSVLDRNSSPPGLRRDDALRKSGLSVIPDGCGEILIFCSCWRRRRASYDDLGGLGNEGITTHMIMYVVREEEEEVMPILGCQSGRPRLYQRGLEERK